MDPRDLSRYVGAAPTWLAQKLVSNYVTNPANGSLVTDTSGLPIGIYDLHVELGSTVALNALNVGIEWRNAANSASVHSVYLLLPATFMNQFFWGGLSVAADERFRVWVYVGFTGTITASIWALRRL